MSALLLRSQNFSALHVAFKLLGGISNAAGTHTSVLLASLIPTSFKNTGSQAALKLGRSRHDTHVHDGAVGWLSLTSHRRPSRCLSYS